MQFDILTIFPDLLQSPLQEGIIRRAVQSGRITVHITNIRDFATDKHTMIDDRPFGGGEGMVMKPEPIAAALRSIAGGESRPRVILLSPQGKTFTQRTAETLALEKHLVFLCGRYEGVDERVSEMFVDDEISIGDYVLTGGELAAMVMVDAITRLLPGVLGCAESASQDTFSSGMLKHPQYTRPREFQGSEVPEVLLTGDHQAIQDWRFAESVKKTLRKRPEMLAGRTFSKAERKVLSGHGLLAEVDALGKRTSD
ncbi:MAG: tRNA (guanosine(37)-N1)-methyltransferase TrmD [Proteobacteria bacterium]|nr:tRNA (guanosine(37)-N1)-methyltransferase TrmD [Pseudomonadota bacterium]MBU1737354.1 tRNA (guanosine(37)-N1)-methyltransferase TrmD [Pseudomonadota bacterium]